ncbi:methyl-accepting chemotaxis protein [Vibrio sp. SM6]|uniref:Methyl-accepting chemotaxis protein n=1 Tax=Vibrio agarilyticus TaxID=2726741 RepID=A0A7X8TSJ8_9VIBR|nr:methyl-accepting chemotaxis protein [Vibrio agarilyticus]NLS14025.1 methyl-accepting chemotaxis protein [Vibrio agarilyticus]
MKATAFRWVDQHLIRISLTDKFLLILLFFTLLVAAMVTAFNQAAEAQLLQLSQSYQTALAATSLAPAQITTALNALESVPTAANVWTYFDGGDWALLVVLLGLTLAALYYVSSFIGGAMYTMNHSLQRMLNGDLTSRMNYLPVRDEFSVIAATVDKVAEREQALVIAIKEAAQWMESLSSQLSQSNRESELLSQQQGVHLDSLVSAIEEMASSIRDVASHAAQTSSDVTQSSGASQHSHQQVSQTLAAIQALRSEIDTASNAVSSLEHNGTEIGSMVATISAISEQTNLLALNAAIEAARAGEQGRGFAVVADEVRTLAGRTQQATIEIQRMIQDLSNNTGHLRTIMQGTVENASASESLMDCVSQEILDIATRSQNISDRTTEIATATNQQGVVASSISSDVEHVREQAWQVTEIIQNTSKNVTDLHQHSSSLTKLVQGIRTE